MYRKLLVALTLGLALILALSACGFHLRGSIDFDLPEGVEPIYIGSSNTADKLQNEIRKLLKAYDVELTTIASEANHQLIILEHKLDRRSASIGRGARAAEIQLIDNVSFEIVNRQGQNVMGPNTLIERRILQNDPNRVASTSSEEALLRREMLSNLASKIARQVNAANYQKKIDNTSGETTTAPQAQSGES
jgi:LPS-assembly lipoprotein